ncbi:MAG: YkgJ family cysteine cluster protein [Kiritimatiellaeota bacterium]|nr:YkgJ family cysteine cluster protein [Kiritimatiellota bacterium]
MVFAGDVVLSGAEFKCRRCGACCRQPGFVRLEGDEAAAIAAFLGLGENEFADKFTDLSADRRALILKEAADGACVLLGADNLCAANPVKPRQCREFPFTWSNGNSAEVCPGIM